MTNTYESADNKLYKTLNRQFREAIELLLAKKRHVNIRGYEEDFCYIIDNIERDAICNQQHHIGEARRLIESIIRKVNEA